MKTNRQENRGSALFQPKSYRKSFRQVSWLGLQATAAFSRKSAMAFSNVADYRPYSGGDHAGFSPASLFSRLHFDNRAPESNEKNMFDFVAHRSTQFKQWSTCYKASV